MVAGRKHQATGTGNPILPDFHEYSDPCFKLEAF